MKDTKLDALLKQLEPEPEIPLEMIEGLLRALELWIHKNNPKIQLLSIKEVGELFGCSPRTIKGLIHDKKNFAIWSLAEKSRYVCRTLSILLSNASQFMTMKF